MKLVFTLLLVFVSILSVTLIAFAQETQAQPTDEPSVTVSATLTPCTVSSEDVDTVQLHVGPGTNRGVISFLPASVQIAATGQITLRNKSIWYQLDKSQAAPNGTAARQLWVAAVDVLLSGDCEQIGETAAPPIISHPTALPSPTPTLELIVVRA